ncbi:metallophosphoesterase family protein [Bradyrhizobium japonicum]|uniref:metallophosphoesterase family protein n=1 Tax=Bradyrhizobium japonicum TaxID=375 RepID=UPI0027151301|nr:metallophosphoesterase [Bradyrhizobium japonicum]WLB24472.1 metallophosphoesterase [Bradyrhizobium japonicum]
MNLLHISDLHFGDKLGGYAVDELSTELPMLISRFPHFEGWLGHHYKALSALHDFHRWFSRNHPHAPVLITGDLTANGATAQFALASAYLNAGTGERNFGLDLGLMEWRRHTISGNHDKWPGSNRIVGRSTTGWSTTFAEPFPIVAPPIEIRRGFAVRLLYIDTDDEVSPFGIDRILARGKFTKQLLALRDQIPPVADDEIRVLIMHHSLMPPPPESVAADEATPANPSRFAPMEIVGETRRVLDHFLVDYGIKVVMCGHLHVPRLTVYRASNGTEANLVLEARCGTTTQRDHYPYELVRTMSSKRKLPPNSLIVHKVVERGRSLIWKSDIFWRNRSGRFVSSSEYNSTFLPGRLSAELQLLPSVRAH